MKKEPYPIQKNITYVFAVSILMVFGGSFMLSLKPAHSVSALQEAASDTPTLPLTFTQTNTPTSTPTLISGVLTCNTVTTGVTCTNYGTYLDYNINKVVTGLTGGATASSITIGSYKRSTNGGYMGMSSDFQHCETSGYSQNTVYSAVGINPFDAGGFLYPSVTGGPGINVCVHDNVLGDWRYVNGSGGWANWLSVKGNVDWPITGYSIVGHIYLYSNQNFMTVTPTTTPTLTPTNTATITPSPIPTATSSPTVTPTETPETWYTGNDQSNAYGIKAVISAPSSLYIDESGESSWVSIPSPYWVQTGWRYYKGLFWFAPKRYIEHVHPITGYEINHYGYQDWGTAEQYQVYWDGGTTWCGAILTEPPECYNLRSAPSWVFARSEIHVSSQNELNTNFSNVYYLDSTFNWLLFNQGNWVEDAPYSVDKVQYYEFHNYRP